MNRVLADSMMHFMSAWAGQYVIQHGVDPSVAMDILEEYPASKCARPRPFCYDFALADCLLPLVYKVSGSGHIHGLVWFGAVHSRHRPPKELWKYLITFLPRRPFYSAEVRPHSPSRLHMAPPKSNISICFICYFDPNLCDTAPVRLGTRHRPRRLNRFSRRGIRLECALWPLRTARDVEVATLRRDLGQDCYLRRRAFP